MLAMRELRRLFPLAAVLLVGSGCAYLKDRGQDLAQSFDVAMGISEGVDVNLRVTKVMQVGVGSYHAPRWFGLKDGLLDGWEEERSEIGIGPFYLHEVFRHDGARLLDIRHPLFGDPGFREHSNDLTHLTDRGWFDVGFTLNLVFLGVDFAFRTAEVADFLTGIGTYDLLDDDVWSPSDSTLEDRIMSSDARTRAAAARALRLRYGQTFGYRVWSAPNEMPAEQITAVRRWREFLETRNGAAGASDAAEPTAPAASPEPAPDPAAPAPGTSP